MRSVSGEAAVTATTAEKAKTFTSITDAKRIASELVSRCVNNTMNGRVCGEIIPYYYCTVCYDDSYGLGISFHYDEEIGLSWNIHTVDKGLSSAVEGLSAEWGELDKARESFDNEYSEYLNYANEVEQCVDWYVEFGSEDIYCWDEICEAVDKHQITKVEAKEKTNWLFNNNSIMYV